MFANLILLNAERIHDVPDEQLIFSASLCLLDDGFDG